MKRSQEFDADGAAEAPAAKRPAKGGGKGADFPCTLKFLMPGHLVSCILGRGGANIKAMRDATGAKLDFTAQNETYPGTDCRVLTARAADEDALVEVTVQLAQKINEFVEQSPDDSVGSPGQLVCKMVVPKGCVGGIIGKGGEKVKQLREITGTQINIASATGHGPTADQIITMVGTATGIENVMAEINTQIQALVEERWFAEWSASPWGNDGGGRGGRHHEEWDSGKGREWDGKGRKGKGGAPSHREEYGKGRGKDHGKNGMSGLKLMVDVAHSLPNYVMEDPRGFALNCIVPNNLVGGIIGRGGSGTKEVQSQTNTKISIREIPGDPENRTLNIVGPLSNSCAAYMLMMKRYLDIEAEKMDQQ